MSQVTNSLLAGMAAIGLTLSAMPAQAAPLPAFAGERVGGPNGTVDTVGWRRGQYRGFQGPRYGHGYGRRGRNIGGAIVAGAALGLIGTAIAASARPRYGYYGYARPVYGYGYPGYGYGYGAPAYGYGYPYAW